jgi:alkylhydroperoxidase family enzyme
MNGFTDEQILEIRSGAAPFDAKFDALAKLTKSITENKGHAEQHLVDAFFAAGYDKGNLVDVVMVVGDKIISNYLHALTNIEIDWPEVPELVG